VPCGCVDGSQPRGERRDWGRTAKWGRPRRRRLLDLVGRTRPMNRPQTVEQGPGPNCNARCPAPTPLQLRPRPGVPHVRCRVVFIPARSPTASVPNGPAPSRAPPPGARLRRVTVSCAAWPRHAHCCGGRRRRVTCGSSSISAHSSRDAPGLAGRLSARRPRRYSIARARHSSQRPRRDHVWRHRRSVVPPRRWAPFTRHERLDRRPARAGRPAHARQRWQRSAIRSGTRAGPTHPCSTAVAATRSPTHSARVRGAVG